MAQEKFDLVIRAQDEATATLKRINGSVNALATGAVPNVTKATDGMAAAFSRADLKMVALGTRLSGLPPVLNNVIQAFAFGSPVVAGLSFGLGILTEAIFSNDEQLTEYVRTLTVTNEQLASLAATTDLVGQKAGFLRDQRLATLKAEEQAIQTQITGINTTKTVAQEYDRLGGITSEQTRAWNEQRIEADNLKLKLEELTGQLATNRGEQAKLTIEDKTAVTVTQERTSALQRLIETNDEWNRSLQSQGQRDWLQGPRNPAEQAAFEAQNLQDIRDLGGPMSLQSEQDDAVRRSEEALRSAQQNFDEFASGIHGALSNAADQLVGIMFGVRATFADIFKGMAQDFASMFLNKILEQAALKLAGTLFSTFFPGGGHVLGGVIGGAGPMSPFGKMASGMDISSAGAGRFASSGYARKSNVNITIAGDVIGDQEYVTRKIIPAIEQAVAYGQSKLTVR